VDIDLDETHGAVRERTATIVGKTDAIPVALWTPADESPVEHLVLVGHGAGGHKRQEYVTALARGLVRRYGFGAVAMDGPVHGDRRRDSLSPEESSTLAFMEFVQAWTSDVDLTDRMVDDWRTVLDDLLAENEFASVINVGYWGLSMGTILGLPLVASEPRIRACVLGLMGATGPTVERIVDDAARITIPTMFLVQWDDELFARSDAFALFDLLGSTDKQLLATPGRHGDVTSENFRRSGEFLHDRLQVEENRAN